jgi:hypothetical protein
MNHNEETNPLTANVDMRPTGIATDPLDLGLGKNRGNHLRFRAIGIAAATAIGSLLMPNIAYASTSAHYNFEASKTVDDDTGILPAALSQPKSVAVDAWGDEFVVNSANSEVDELTRYGNWFVVAGDGVAGPATPGLAENSELDYPTDVTINNEGVLYISDAGDNEVDEVKPGGMLSVVAGNGNYGNPVPGLATESPLATPDGIAINPRNDDLVIANKGTQFAGGNVITEVTPRGMLSVIAGRLTASGSPTVGRATQSKLASPEDVAFAENGTLYIADTGNNVIDAVSPWGDLYVFAGELGAGTGTLTPGPATKTTFNSPAGVDVDRTGNVYIANTGGDTVAKVNRYDRLSIIAGNGANGSPTIGGSAVASALNNPEGVAVNNFGDVYIADTNNNLLEEVNRSGTIELAAS